MPSQSRIRQESKRAWPAVRGRGRLRAAALLFGLLMLIVPGGRTLAHPGDVDEFGGHFDARSNSYHYHKPVWDIAKRTKEFLNWTVPGEKGEVIGTVTKIERPDAIWIKVPYRPAFENLAKSVSTQNRDNQQMLVQVWFRYVSPERSALTESSEYVTWFRKKVVFELDRKLMNRQVTVQFQVDAVSGRPFAMVLLGEENINVWLVLHGWSYTLLANEKTPYDKAFQDAEEIARREKAGIWSRNG